MSRQKELIYELVTSTMSHPTADWVYQNARRKMPHISLGTVYRNLNTLVREGRILAITNSRGPVRYDANITRHSHLNCVGCGLMLDVPEAEIDFAPRSPKIRQFEVLEYRIEFFCLCPDCRKKKRIQKTEILRRIHADPERQKSKPHAWRRKRNRKPDQTSKRHISRQ